MEFINHSLEWCRGEIFEGKMLLLYALSITLVSLAFWKYGSTPYSKSMVTPLVFVAMLIGIIGMTLVTANTAATKLSSNKIFLSLFEILIS